MRKFVTAFSFAALASLSSAAAFGQAPAATTPEATPAAAEPAPATTTEVAPTPATEPAVEPTPAAEPVAEPAAEAPAAPAEETFPAAWFRMDSDGGGLQLWAGATHSFTPMIGLATDIYILQSLGSSVTVDGSGSGSGVSQSLGEFDIGPTFTLGPVIVTPMIGFQFDFGNKRTAAIVPQLYAVGGPDPVYFEFWFQNYNYTMFQETAGNYGYIRFFFDFKLGKYLAIGPQIEATWAFNDAAKANDETLTSLPIGGSVILTSYGKNNSLLLFAGYEAAKNYSNRDFAGRLTFIHNF